MEMLAKTVNNLHIARVNKMREYLATRKNSGKAQETIFVLHSRWERKITKRRAYIDFFSDTLEFLHNQRFLCLPLKDNRLVTIYRRERSRTSLTYVIEELADNIAAIKILSNNRYSPTSFEGLLAAGLETANKRWTTKQWRSSICSWEQVSDELIRGAEIAAIAWDVLTTAAQEQSGLSDEEPDYGLWDPNDELPSARLLKDFYEYGGEEKISALYDGILLEDILVR